MIGRPAGQPIPASKMRATLMLLLVLAAATPAVHSQDCDASDYALESKRWMVCKSGVGTTGCLPVPSNVTAKGDWPTQVTYMHDLLVAVADPSTCLNTSTARGVVSWLNTNQSDPADGGTFFGCWQQFQGQYYDMPRKPGDRIESPDTLGRKCWAFAYLNQVAEKDGLLVALQNAAGRAGLELGAFIQSYQASIAYSMPLCEQVMANCFINSTYTPSRKGSCPLKVSQFHYLGFDRENIKRHNEVKYPF
jgi:hypothetical protein